MSRQHEIIVDSFAGGGGASLGIAWATGKSPDIAINHDAKALEMHAKNHPDTLHVQENVWRADLRKLVEGRKVGLLWASPDCRHFSRAKGDKPVSKQIRSLAWVCVRWATQVRPRVIMLENVSEFSDWGPLLPAFRCTECGWRGTEGQAKLARTRRRCPRCNSARLKQTDKWLVNPDKKGLTFKRWVGRLRNLGYAIQWKKMDAADFGAPTHRRRLFLIARCDGRPIEWPEHTHGDPKKLNDMPLFTKLHPWRTAAECIDWSIQCRSIFDRKKPLKENSLRRVAFGLKRYVLEAAEPFLVCCNHGGDEFRGQSIGDPISTITASRDATGVILPTLVTVGYGERDGQSPRVPGLDKPLGAVVAGGQKHALVAAMLAKFYGGVVGHGVDRPIGTVTAVDHHGLVAAHLTKFRFDSDGRPLTEPLPTITAGGNCKRPAGAAHAMGLTMAYLARFNHGDKQWNDVREPLGTVTSQGNKFGLVFAFLVKYNGTAIGQALLDSLGTVTSKHRYGLVFVRLESGEVEPAVVIDVPGVGLMAIADIGLRMLTPRELARAQGFPDTYLLTGPISNQVARIGNSVCPIMPQRLIEANYVPQMITT